MISRYRLFFGRTCSNLTEHPAFGDWLGEMKVSVSHDPRCEGYRSSFTTEHRIHIGRNQLVDIAKKIGSTYILFADCDMDCDFRLMKPHTPQSLQPEAREWAKPFLSSSLNFMMTEKVGVIGSPAVSAPPANALNVFLERDDGAITRMSHEEYAGTTPSFMQCAAIGTGLMLIDMEVFNILKPPYFEDLAHPDGDDLTKVHQSQDSRFCLKCCEAGIPVYANLYAPSGHFKTTSCKTPDWKGAV